MDDPTAGDRSWYPDLARGTGPKYLRLARAIEQAVSTGALGAGDQLPPQRELAHALDVTQGTVSRAYREVQGLGIADGQVGRGTFIVGARGGSPARGEDGVADLALARPIAGLLEPRIRRELTELSRGDDLGRLLDYQTEPRPRDGEAGAAWLAVAGVESDPRHITLTAGGQHGLELGLTALAKAGDTVVTEALTYPGVFRAAERRGVTLVPLPLDEEGPTPEGLEAALAGAPAAACFTPVLHNPTSRTWSEARYRAIADLLQGADVPVVEDDIYRPLHPDAPPPLVGRGPKGVLVSSISKALVPGLRVGYAWSTPDLTARMRDAIAATLIMVPPLNAELAARLLLSGDLDAHLADHRERIRDRQRVLRSALRGIDSDARGLHAWVRLETGNADAVAQAALTRGVAVRPASAFAVSPEHHVDALRVTLGGSLDDDAFAAAVAILADILTGSPRTTTVI